MPSPQDEHDPTSPLDSPLGSPSTPTSPEGFLSPATDSKPRAGAPSFANSPMASMTASSTPRGTLDAARGPPSASSLNMSSDMAARLKAFSITRQNARASPMSPGGLQSPGPVVAGFPSNFKLPPQLGRPAPSISNSSPAVPGRAPPPKLSLAEKRGLQLPSGALAGRSPVAPQPGGRIKPKMTLSDMNRGASDANGQRNGDSNGGAPPRQQSNLEKYAHIINTETGTLNFAGKAVISSEGVTFASGQSFQISLEEVETIEELGKGNYGTVYQVRHSRPKFRKQGHGLAGNKPLPGTRQQKDEENAGAVRSPEVPSTPTNVAAANSYGRGSTTGIVMAMKEMRLELDDSKFQTIIMELDILHRCISPYIIDFYGAFFQEGAVYICIEFMDGGSVDKLYGDGVPEGVLRKITHATVQGLKCLKDEHNIIHRDVKPTNILVNTRGQVKICDFGVSGNLVASIAKTNIGCQSYMAPERISSGGMSQAGAGAGTYSVQSDIWSLGLSIIECAMGQYPYPPETYDNIFSQLSAIVDGEPPDLPSANYSEAARNFVAGCLNKIPNLRPTYSMLLQHAWLAPLDKPSPIAEVDEDTATAAANDADAPQPPSAAEAGQGAEKLEPTAAPPPSRSMPQAYDQEVRDWVLQALERRKNGTLSKKAKPALHAAPLDAVSSPNSPRSETPATPQVAA